MKSVIVYQQLSGRDFIEQHIGIWIIKRYLTKCALDPLIINLPYDKDLEPPSLFDKLDIHYVGNALTVNAVKYCIVQHHFITFVGNDYFYAGLLNKVLGREGVTLYPIPQHLQGRLRVVLRPGTSLTQILWEYYLPGETLPKFIEELSDYMPIIERLEPSFTLYEELLVDPDSYNSLIKPLDVIKLNVDSLGVNDV